jgi:dienelactone hydrolase
MPAAAQETTPEATDEPAVARQDFTVEFGDFTSDAQITYPAGEEGPFPTIILIPGGGPADMDFTVYDLSGELVSTNFKDIADYLPQNGYAVVRYNKHYVSAPNDVDTRRFVGMRLPQLVSDAGAVVDTALANPLVDVQNVFLFGWSEGSLIAADLVARRVDEFAGVVFQGPVALSYRETFAAQITEVTVPYLRSFAPDGQITSDILQAALDGDGGSAAKNGLLYIFDLQRFRLGQIAISADLDTNGDGVLSLDDELLPAVDQLLDNALSANGFLAIFGNDVLPTTTEQAANLTIPVLIMQGERDANTPARGAQVLYDALDEAGNIDIALLMYAELGHSLGPAGSVTDDRFRPIAQQPLDDLAAWLAEHIRSASGAVG